MKKVIAAALTATSITLAFSLSACATDAEVASHNLSKEADNFNIPRRVVFVNGITDQYLLSIEGYCSIEDEDDQLEVTCKVGDEYKKHFLGLSDNVTYFAEQLAPTDASTDHYKVVFKPESIIPNVDIR